ncbi:hypothetical protein ElyMa_006633500 [Elysia marginata]|uniref:Uncharacterized protein n=1 Tax=Elysia marginata TaxID=1093978 RepID=A0AAV4IKN1_9GAST|nr:hypothetical protein ElyMa_006633500 [Elysia marginata]
MAFSTSTVTSVVATIYLNTVLSAAVMSAPTVSGGTDQIISHSKENRQGIWADEFTPKQTKPIKQWRFDMLGYPDKTRRNFWSGPAQKSRKRRNERTQGFEDETRRVFHTYIKAIPFGVENFKQRQRPWGFNDEFKAAQSKPTRNRRTLLKKLPDFPLYRLSRDRHTKIDNNGQLGVFAGQNTEDYSGSRVKGLTLTNIGLYNTDHGQKNFPYVASDEHRSDRSDFPDFPHVGRGRHRDEDLASRLGRLRDQRGEHSGYPRVALKRHSNKHHRKHRGSYSNQFTKFRFHVKGSRKNTPNRFKFVFKGSHNNQFDRIMNETRAPDSYQFGGVRNNENFQTSNTSFSYFNITGRIDIRFSLKQSDPYRQEHFNEALKSLNTKEKQLTSVDHLIKSIFTNASWSVFIQTKSKPMNMIQRPNSDKPDDKFNGTNKPAISFDETDSTSIEKPRTSQDRTDSLARTTNKSSKNFNRTELLGTERTHQGTEDGVFIQRTGTNYGRTLMPLSSTSKPTTAGNQVRAFESHEDSLGHYTRKNETRSTTVFPDDPDLETLLEQLVMSKRDVETCREKLDKKVLEIATHAVQKVNREALHGNATRDRNNNDSDSKSNSSSSRSSSSDISTITAAVSTTNDKITNNSSNTARRNASSVADIRGNSSRATDTGNSNRSDGAVNSGSANSPYKGQGLFDMLTHLPPEAIESLDKNHSIKLQDQLAAGGHVDEQDLIPLTIDGQQVLYEPGIKLVDYADWDLASNNESQTIDLPPDPVGDAVNALLTLYSQQGDSKGLNASDEVLIRLKQDLKFHKQELSFCRFSIKNLMPS